MHNEAVLRLHYVRLISAFIVLQIHVLDIIFIQDFYVNANHSRIENFHSRL